MFRKTPEPKQDDPNREYITELVKKHATGEKTSFLTIIKKEVCDELSTKARECKQRFDPSKILKANSLPDLKDAIEANRNRARTVA